MTKEPTDHLLQLLRAIWILSSLLLIDIYVATAQQEFKVDLIEKNRIQTIDAYLFSSEAMNDSFLITRELFNIKGRTTRKEIHSKTSLRCAYDYYYKDDTLRTERITTCNGKFSSRTLLYYDKKMREKKAEDFDENGKRTGTYSINKYNDRKKTKEQKVYFNGKLSIWQTIQYDDQNKIVSSVYHPKSKWTPGKEKNVSTTETTENYNGTAYKLVKIISIIKKEETILGVAGSLKLKPEDELISETLFHPNGLTFTNTQYLNGELVGIKKYNYEMWER